LLDLPIRDSKGPKTAASSRCVVEPESGKAPDIAVSLRAKVELNQQNIRLDGVMSTKIIGIMA
jgi:hypothetical protein